MLNELGENIACSPQEVVHWNGLVLKGYKCFGSTECWVFQRQDSVEGGSTCITTQFKIVDGRSRPSSPPFQLGLMSF